MSPMFRSVIFNLGAQLLICYIILYFKHLFAASETTTVASATTAAAATRELTTKFTSGSAMTTSTVAYHTGLSFIFTILTGVTVTCTQTSRV